MTEPVSAINPGETAKLRPDGRSVGRPFERGNGVGRMGGRPKGLGRRVRDEVEGDNNLLVTIMLQHASGYRQLIHTTEKDEATKSGYVEEWQEVSVADQRAAVMWLADRGYGKAKEFVEIEDPLEPGPDPHAFSADFEKAMDELAVRRREAEARREADRAAEQ